MSDKRRIKAYDANHKESLHKKVMKRAAAAKMIDQQEDEYYHRKILLPMMRSQNHKQPNKRHDSGRLLGIVQPAGFEDSS